MQLSEIARTADVALERDGEFLNLGFLPDQNARMLVFFEDERFSAALENNPCVSAVLATPKLAPRIPRRIALATCESPRRAFAGIHNALADSGFYWNDFATIVDPTAHVHPSAWIVERNVRIGAETVIGPRAVVLERSILEDNVTVGAGAVLGAVGFQTVRSSRPMIEMKHAGGLTLRSSAHVLPGAVIATGIFRHHTEIRADGRIGSQAFVSHAVRIGERSFVGHGAVVNGNVVVGDDVWIGPGAVVSNNLIIGDRATISLGAIVIRDVAAGDHVSGNFATDHRRLLRLVAEMESGG